MATCNILSILIFLPLLAAVVILLFIKDPKKVRWIALAATVLDFAVAALLIFYFDPSTYQMQFVEKYAWIPSLDINYYLGVDGISVLFVFLTALLGWMCVLISWRSVDFKVKEFMIALLVLQSAMIGVFCALDFVLFYAFWEVMLIPMYLIIGVWGGANRIYSAIKFFLYTLAGSVLLLAGIIALYYAGGKTFEIPMLMGQDYSFTFQAYVFIAFFIAFAIKVPMFPFHTWLPDAHVDAPTAGSVILAGILLKMGTYGFIRFLMPMFPEASQYFAFPVIVLSIIAIIYGAFLALAQQDMKKLIAYSSVSHMGFITMGLFLFNKDGIEGGILQMFNHGITTSALFVCVGLIYERTHSRDISTYGWAAKKVPIYAVFLFIFTIASLGFPGTNGFIGEILILFGAWDVNPYYIILLIIGITLGAAYMLWLYERVAFGANIRPDTEGGRILSERRFIEDVNPREFLVLICLVFFVFLVGLKPTLFLDIMHESVVHLMDQVNGGSILTVVGK
jgi:NADH-quinone oxidoreductase subunit M